MSDSNELKLSIARYMPGWVRWALYGVTFGLTLSTLQYVADHWLVYVSFGWSFAMTWFFCDFYRRWSHLHNINAFRQLGEQLNDMLSTKLDGTLDDETCLTKGRDEEESSTDGS